MNHGSGDIRIDEKKNSDSTGDYVELESVQGGQIIFHISVFIFLIFSGFTDVAIEWIGRTKVLRRGFLEF